MVSCRPTLEPVFLHPGKAVCHGDARMRSRAVGHKQPAPQGHVTVDGELDVLPLDHDLLLPRPFMRDNIEHVCAASEKGKPQ
jgi:hypothetical protein